MGLVSECPIRIVAGIRRYLPCISAFGFAICSWMMKCVNGI